MTPPAQFLTVQRVCAGEEDGAGWETAVFLDIFPYLTYDKHGETGNGSAVSAQAIPEATTPVS